MSFNESQKLISAHIKILITAQEVFDGQGLF